MIFKVQEIIQNRKSKKGYALRLLVSTGLGDSGDLDLIHVFAKHQTTIKPGELLELVPASDANFFMEEKNLSDQIGALI